jgi:hypothetical protein
MTNPPTRWSFLIDAHPESDALIRILTPFAVQAADLTDVALSRANGGLRIRVDAEGLSRERAETLLHRLEGLAVVRRVGLGWQSAIQATG